MNHRAVVWISIFAVGCGGKVLFESSSGDDGAGAGNPSGTSTGTKTSGTNTNTATGTGTNTSGTNNGSTTGIVGTSVGPSTTTGGFPPIACGNGDCDAETEICCATQMDASCQPQGSNCQGISLHCSSVAQCTGGKVCCAHFGGGDAEATCEDDCGNGGPGTGVQLCEDSSECLNNQDCNPAPGGLGFCGGFGGGNGPGPGGGG